MKRGPACVIHSGALGDFVLTLSVVQAIRCAGYAPIRFIGRSNYAALVGPHDGVDDFTSIDAAPWHRLFGDDSEDAIARIVLERCPTLVLDMLGISESANGALRSAGVAEVIQVDARPTPGKISHIITQWRDSIRSGGIELDLRAPSIRRKATPSSDDSIIIHVGSGGIDKCWPIDNWIDLARSLRADGVGIVFPFGPAETERADLSLRRRQLEPIGRIVESVSLEVLATRIASARAFCGNDSGLTHLAAALGTPTIAVFGATDPRIWGPTGRHVLSIGQSGGWPSVSEVRGAANAMRSLTVMDGGKTT